MIFRSKHSFWQRRGIRSLEYDKMPTFKDVVGPEANRQVIQRQLDAARRAEEWRRGGQDSEVQGLRDQGRTDPQAQTGTTSRPSVRDTPPSEEESRQ